MEMDWKTNMAELGGAFMVSLLVLGEMDDGSMVMAGLLLAVTMAAMAGAHVLPMFTWISAMTGDLQDTDAWMSNGMRLVFQLVGACLAALLMAEGGDVAANADISTWGFELWGPDAAEGADVNHMDGAVMMLAGGALIGAIASRCDGWMTAFAVVALAGSLGAGVDGASMMAGEMLGSGDIVAGLSHWVVDGVVIGLGAMLGGMIDEQL